jgi:hypothetical protein
MWQEKPAEEDAPGLAAGAMRTSSLESQISVQGGARKCDGNSEIRGCR